MPHSRMTESRLTHRSFFIVALVVASATAGARSAATELVVRVGGLEAPFGQVGCSLFAGPAGFPMDNTVAQVQWHAASPDGVICRYAGVAPGRYAVSIAHDRNGNRQVDTNFLGMPTEPWGVSNNVRPNLRAPRFNEAQFSVDPQAAELVIDIKVAQ